MDHTVIRIEKILAAYERAKGLDSDHDAACAAAAQALGIPVESVRNAIAMVQGVEA